MSFASLKKQSSLGSLTAKLVKEVEKTNSTNKGDERLWKPEVDKAGNGYAVIRFLPAPDGEDLPWVKLYSHAFQGPGGWYIENSLTTVNGKDPCSEFNTQLWNSGVESDKQIARNQKRKLSYFANIYVVKDPANPSNEGQVFLYKFGKKIFDKIMEAMKPEFADETPINPFDFWAGANFKLKIRRVEGYQNYDKSEFDNASPLFDDDDKLEKIYNSLHDLSEFTTPDKFKSYDDLKKRLVYVLGMNQPAKRVDPEVAEEDATWERERRGDYSEATTTPTPEPVVASSESDEDDESLSYFSKLVNS